LKRAQRPTERTPEFAERHDDGSSTRIFRALRRQWLLAVVITLAVVAVAMVWAAQRPTMYSATVRLRLATPGSLSGEAIRPDAVEYVDRLQNTFFAIASSDPLRQQLVEQLGLTSDPQVSITTRPVSELIDLVVSTEDEAVAVPAANRLTTLLVDEIRRQDAAKSRSVQDELQPRVTELENAIAALTYERAVLSNENPNPDESVLLELSRLDTDLDAKRTSLRDQRELLERTQLVLLDRSQLLSVVEAASTTTESSRPFLTTLVLSLLVGGLAGACLALAAERTRRFVQWPKDVEERLDREPLAVVGRVRGHEGIDTTSRVSDEIWQLRTELLLRAERQEMRSILITSSERRSDASWLALNVGAAVARAGTSVVVIDADPQAATVRSAIGGTGPGLTRALVGDDPVHALVTPTELRHLHVLAGDAPADRDAVTPARMMKVLAELEATYELVIVHSPGLRDGGMPAAIATMVSAVLLTVRIGSSRLDELEDAESTLARAGQSSVDVVIVEPRRASRAESRARPSELATGSTTGWTEAHSISKP
jgi:Mrp family chromosome partitioning ATPase